MQCHEHLISIFCVIISLQSAQSATCVPPVVDLLFIIDGTVNVGMMNFQKIKEFVTAYTKTMDIGVRASRVALAQFTPQSRPELYLVNSIDINSVVKAINNVQYNPCTGCTSAASINSMAQFAMNTVSGNREWVPDALVIIASDAYRPPEISPNETLLQPVSPIHAFDINVGSIKPNQVNLPYAATTVKLSALDFGSLMDLVSPLCESMVTYVDPNGNNVNTGAFGGSCVIILLLVIITAIILLLMFGYILYKYKQENDELRLRVGSADFQDLNRNQYATNRTGQVVRDRIERVADAGASTVYANAAEVGAAAIGGKVVNTKVINGRLYNDRDAGYRPDGTVINGSAEERIVNRVINGVVGNVMVKKPRKEGKAVSQSAEGRIADRVVNGVVNGVLVKNKGKPLTYDDVHSDDLEMGHGRNNYEGRDANGRLADEHDRHHLENATNTLLAEASTPAGTSTILGDGNTFPSTEPEDNGHDGFHSPRKGMKDDKNTPSPTKEVHVRVGDPDAENNADKQRDSVVSPLNLGLNDSNGHEDGDHPNSIKEETNSETETDSEAELEKEYSELDRRTKARNKSHLPRDHPARKLAPVDVLLVVDNSGSIGMVNYEKVKEFLESVLDGVDISPGRSRVGMVLYSSEPHLYFSFDKFYSNKAVRAAVKRMPYQGGSTFLAKALSFAAGVLSQEQNMKHIKKRKHKYLPTPRHDRLQVLIVASDGYSEDNFEKVSGIFHDKLRVKVGAVAVRSFHKERLLPITRFDGSIFLLDQREAMSNWLWKQQRLWQENFGQYVEKEKSAMENTFRSLIDSPKKKK